MAKAKGITSQSPGPRVGAKAPAVFMVLVAVLASIATSEPFWTENDRKEAPTVRLEQLETAFFSLRLGLSEFATENTDSSGLIIHGIAEVEHGDAPPNVTGRLYRIADQEPEVLGFRLENATVPNHRRSTNWTLQDCMTPEALFDDAGVCWVEFMVEITNWDPVPVEVDWAANLQVSANSPFYDQEEFEEPPEVVLVEIDFLGTDFEEVEDEDDAEDGGEGDE